MVDMFTDVVLNSDIRLNAAKEIIRQIKSSSRFVSNIQKNKWLSVSGDTKKYIKTKVSVIFLNSIHSFCSLYSSIFFY